MAIYLDNNAVSQPSEATVEAMQPFLRERFGLPSAPHKVGQDLHPSIREAYEAFYTLFGADHASTVLFTSSGTEAVNQVLQGAYLDVSRETGRNHFVTSTVDEAAAILTIGRLEELGCSGSLADVDASGAVTAETIGDCLTPRTALVSLSWANGLTGVVQPVEEIAELCQERGILLHLDATHIAGKLPIDLDELPIDFVTLDGSRIHGPRGSGLLYIRRGLKLRPLLLGGTEQAGLRAGPIDVANMIGLGQAAKEAVQHLDTVAMETARLRLILEQATEAIPGAYICHAESERIPTTCALAFSGLTSDALLFMLAEKGVYGNFGGAGFQRINLVLEAAGIDPDTARGAISFALSRDTTEAEVVEAARILKESVEALQKMSKEIVGQAS